MNGTYLTSEAMLPMRATFRVLAVDWWPVLATACQLLNALILIVSFANLYYFYYLLTVICEQYPTTFSVLLSCHITQQFTILCPIPAETINHGLAYIVFHQHAAEV